MSSIEETSPLIQPPSTDQETRSRCLQAIAQLHLAASAAELLDGMAETIACMGATAALYTVAIPEPLDQAFTFTLFACDPLFVRAQEAIAPIQDHPWVRLGHRHSTAFTDSEVVAENQRDEAQLVLAHTSGFRSCLVIPSCVSVARGRQDVLWVGAATPGAFDDPRSRPAWSLARAMASEIQDWLTRHFHQRLRRACRLRQHDVELLHMEWQGLSTKEIAARHGVSMVAVDSRFQRLNSKLGSVRRTDAARRAAEYGLFEALPQERHERRAPRTRPGSFASRTTRPSRMANSAP